MTAAMTGATPLAEAHVVWPRLNEQWFKAVNGFARHTGWLHAPARVIATYGVVAFAVILVASWWIARGSADPRRSAAAIWAPLGTLVAVGLNQLISHAVAEPRPFAVLPDVLVLVHRSTDFSFPSDHSVMAGAITVGVLLSQRRGHWLGLITAALAVAMAASRVYVGVHFPLDVVAGLGVGAVVAWVTSRAVGPLLVGLVSLLQRRRPLAKIT